MNNKFNHLSVIIGLIVAFEMLVVFLFIVGNIYKPTVMTREKPFTKLNFEVIPELDAEERV